MKVKRLNSILITMSMLLIIIGCSRVKKQNSFDVASSKELDEKIKFDNLIFLLDFEEKDSSSDFNKLLFLSSKEESKSLNDFIQKLSFREMRNLIFYQKDSLGFNSAVHSAFKKDSSYLFCVIATSLLSQHIYEEENNLGKQDLFLSIGRGSIAKIKKHRALTYYLIKYANLSLSDIDLLPSSVILSMMKKKNRYPKLWNCEGLVTHYENYEYGFSSKQPTD